MYVVYIVKLCLYLKLRMTEKFFFLCIIDRNVLCFLLKCHARNSVFHNFMYFTLNIVGNIIFSATLLITTIQTSPFQSSLFLRAWKWADLKRLFRAIFGSDRNFREK